MSGSAGGDWLDDTYWYVPSTYLPALLAINASPPVVATVSDQTVWHFDDYSNGYITGIGATNIGFGWSYTLIVGSVTSDGTVKLSFSPLGSANPSDPTSTSVTIGDGTLSGSGNSASFLMQMTSGTAALSLTHWAYMLPVGPDDPEWSSLPGYPAIGVPDLTELQTPIISCFASGTLIETTNGPVPVEDVREGTMLRTREGRAAPVIWRGYRSIECRRHPSPKPVWPVRVAAGAFGPARPFRDLWLSPDHAVYADDVLIPVKYLINGHSIAQVEVERVTYWHIELPRHDVIMANGLPTESFLDTGNRSAFDNGGKLVTLFPDFSSLTWESDGALPLVASGPIVNEVRRQLAARHSRRQNDLRQRKRAAQGGR